MKKTTILGGITLAALAPMLIVSGATAAPTAGCISSPGTGPVLGVWAKTANTAWQTDPDVPADPDHQAGDDNVLNTVQLGAVETRTGDESVDDSGWVTEPPAGAGWVLAETRDVSNDDGWTETIPGTPGFWSNFEPTDEHAPLQGAPSYPTDLRGKWSAPKIEGGPQEDASGVYQNGNGNGSWFYRKPATANQTVEHPATTHPEYRYERTTPGVTEYRWAIWERVNAPATDPVTCEGQPPVEGEDPAQGVGGTVAQPPAPVTPVEPAGAAPGTGTPTVSVVGHSHGIRAHHGVIPAAAAVPTVIDAGL